jgi:Arc/MetJ family transcription regulator
MTFRRQFATLMCFIQHRMARTTIALDDNLTATAQEYTGVMEKSALMCEALKALIEREASRRLAELGGASADLAYIPRRRTKAK